MSGDGMHSDVVEGRNYRPSTPSTTLIGIIARSTGRPVEPKSNCDPWRRVDMSKHC